MNGLILLVRTLVQAIGIAFVGIGGVALYYDAGVFLAGDGRMSQPFGQIWFQHDPFVGLVGTSSIQFAGAIIERKIYPPLWNPVMTTILSWPSWVGLLTLGVFFVALGSIVFWASTKIFRTRR